MLSRLNIIQFQSYYPDGHTHTHTHWTDCSTRITNMVGNYSA